jgi:prepilin-type N-terminal cleavage/methylation domain-containing protein
MKTMQPDSRERGFTLIELAIVVIVLGILMSLAVAAVFRARMSANEGSAIAALRTINTAQFQYQSGCGSGLYAGSLAILGTPAKGESQPLLPGDLGGADTPTRSGYTFNMRMGAGGAATTPDCMGRPTVSRYYVSAVPEEPTTGTRSFATSHIGTLWQTTTTTAPTEPFGPPSLVVD